MDGTLYLEDGTIYKGKGFGKKGTSVGELVFNTSITGYQEILTDPSYAGQIINMAYPLIGNYGINEVERESSRIFARGLVVKSASSSPSNYMSEGTIDSMLKKMGIVGLCDVDTRSITKKIRNCGALKCVISSEGLIDAELKKYIDENPISYEFMKEVSTKNVYHIPGTGCRAALVDLGVKAHIIENLKARNCDITVFPYNASYEEIMSINPSGVLFSNGPGDPVTAVEAIETAGKIMRQVPTFGICLGHQIICLAAGGHTYKMKYGHRGSNHGVYDIEMDRAYITSQNHGYAVDRESVEKAGFIITHINLNDNTVEGMRLKELPVFSVQFHPEGSPGPEDSDCLFDKFVSLMKGGVQCH